MDIPKRYYVPDQETIQHNKCGKFSLSQEKHFSIYKDIQIYHVVDKFEYNSEDEYFGFLSTSITFDSSETETACRDGQLLPGATYSIYYTKDHEGKEIFLSAEVAQIPHEKVVYNEIIEPLKQIFGFSKTDLNTNTRGHLSASQLEYLKKYAKRFSNFQVSTYDFIFIGDMTLEETQDLRFIEEISEHFSSHDCAFLQNTEYRIYYETNTEEFLSIEPIQLLEVTYAKSFLKQRGISPMQEANISLVSIIASYIFFGLFLIMLVGASFTFIALSIWMISDSPQTWVIAFPIGGFGLYLLFITLQIAIQWHRKRLHQSINSSG